MSTQILSEPNQDQFDLAVETFKLMGDNTRLRIIWALLHGEHSVNELASHLLVNPAGVSQHLAKLRFARLVVVRREGNKAFYSLEHGHVRRLVEQALFHVDHSGGIDPVHVDDPARNSRARA
jgi:DNA-binding transcriptional ArsR family regulator